jgi:hypothetical protein
MLECMADRTPAVYRVRLTALAEECTAQKPGGQNTIKTYVEVVSGDGPSQAGSVFLVLHMQSQYGREDFNEQCVALAGYDPRDEADVNAFVTFDPDGHFFAACVGDANDYKTEAQSMVGRVADVQVGYKKDDGKGGYFRTYKWAPVSDDDEDQNVSPKIERVSA